MQHSSLSSNQKLISRDTALEMLISVSLDLKKLWENYINAEYQNYDEGRLDYVDIGEIPRYIVAKKKYGDTSAFHDFFHQVEMILLNGDDYSKNLIVIGLLEGIQNGCGDEIDYHIGFNDWLKPETKKAWIELIQFWEENEL